MRSTTTSFLLSLSLAAMLSACNPPPEQDLPTSGTPDADTAAEPVPAPATGAPDEPTATDQPAIAPDEASAAQCGADQLGDFVNVLPTSDILDKIKERIGDKTIRVIGPGDAVTMDFRPDRLNAETGADGRIKQFRCY